MKEDFKGEFELFDFRVKRSGQIIDITFECNEDIELEREIIEFRGENVKVFVCKVDNENDNFEIICDVIEIKVPRNKRKLQLVLQHVYEKEVEITLAGFRFCECVLNLIKIQKELDFDESPDSIVDMVPGEKNSKEVVL